MGWTRDFYETLRKPNGWSVLGKLIISFITVVGVIYVYGAYKADRIENSIERAENSYYKFIESFSSDNESIRIGATYQIPDLMNKKVPVSSDVSIFRLFRPRYRTVYKYEMQKILYNRIKQFTNEYKNWSFDELDALVRTLLYINKSGWYEQDEESSINRNEDSVKKKRFNWLWDKTLIYGRGQQSTYDIFSGNRLDGFNFSNTYLQNPNFHQASLKGSKFNYSEIKEGDFDEANLSSSKFELSKLESVNFKNANLGNVFFYKCEIYNANFSKDLIEGTYCTNLNSSSFQGSRIRLSRFQNINMERVKFVNSFIDSSFFDESVLTSCDFSNITFLGSSSFIHSILDSAMFVNSKISNTNFRLSDLRFASFKNASIVNCNFEGADLRGAVMNSVILNDTLTNWKDANIANIQGLNQEQKTLLIKKGAVEYSSNSSWNNFKITGRRNVKRRNE